MANSGRSSAEAVKLMAMILAVLAALTPEEGESRWCGPAKQRLKQGVRAKTPTETSPREQILELTEAASQGSRAFTIISRGRGQMPYLMRRQEGVYKA
mmetsp:Transcript_16339/g.28642  ORF Transcript_16339/g.28642 Transcript_16339/m.28642 type:complete len:98 (+) Transcript_16339:3394-3687(+)